MHKHRIFAGKNLSGSGVDRNRTRAAAVIYNKVIRDRARRERKNAYRFNSGCDIAEGIEEMTLRVLAGHGKNNALGLDRDIDRTVSVINNIGSFNVFRRKQ